ncbi:MAG: SapC family protein [Rubrivivax sp.]|nr:SapC family protein [Rubrivivax sp.]
MITPQLHREAVPLDSVKHRSTVVRFPVEDWSHLAGMNSLFLTADECILAAADYPIVFIQGSPDAQGVPEFVPIAVFGMSQGENLYLEQGRWRGVQMPALMATYPFCIAQLGTTDRMAVCVDNASSALASSGAGQRLFDDQGQATAFAGQVQKELEQLERQIANTRAIVRRLAALDLFRPRSFDATLPDGSKLGVDGFFTIDEERVRQLPDAQVLELHRDGILTLVSAHWVSLAQMRRLLQWRVERMAQNKG